MTVLLFVAYCTKLVRIVVASRLQLNDSRGARLTAIRVP
jgi:hypothetical protein